MINLFVYGTLMFPEVVKALTDKEFLAKEASLKRYSRYRANGPEGLDPYPAIIEEKNGIVNGKILFDVDPRSLKIFDFFEMFEDHRYRKIKVVVDVDGKQTEAFVYVWTEENRKYLTDLWDPERFRKDGLKNFLKTIPEVLAAYKANC